MSWQNWSGKLKAKPNRIAFLRSEADAAALAKQADTNGQHIRVAGATHSHSPLVISNEILADPQGLTGLFAVDQATRTAWVGAGTRIYALGQPLHANGLALTNQGDIDRQAICGATATGTHGTGTRLKNLSSAVIGARIALASGELVECGPDHNAELWQASRLHLGAFGIITRLHLQLEDAYRLKEHSWTANLAETLSHFAEDAAAHRHHEFFWYPHTDEARGKSIDRTEEPAQYPLGGEGERCAWSYEVLPNHRPHKHTEMEYSIPFEHGPACMRDIQQLLTTDFPDVRWPVEYRTLAADDVWLSTAYERPTITISVHEDIARDDEGYFRACEEIFLHHKGRPHWGKVNYLSRNQLADQHKRWDDWWRVRNSVDPKGTFLNPYLKSLQP
ncbi:MAG: FAD-binding protein [Pseudomonadaceae bacterium]|nr:FAD-binding protein [Pseudomonadaceae bacterium]